MKFSEYIVLARPGLIMDPLGFLGPYTALQDKLFMQFTVLSNFPAYHGVLAVIYQYLAANGISPKHKTFSRAFREVEIFWGLLHAVDADSSSVLNITKYEELMRGRNDIALSDITAGDRLYLRLGYGTLGHYSNPSIAWGILGKSGQQLTERGTDLANAFGNRKGHSMGKAMALWRKNTRWGLAELKELAVLFQVDAPPDRSEAKVWQTLIAEYCARSPQVRSLWETPLKPAQYEVWNDNPLAYAEGFSALRKLYPELRSELMQIQRFEQLVGLVQYIFEREYLGCAAKVNGPLPSDALEDELATDLGKIAWAYIQAQMANDTKSKMFLALAGVRSYGDAAALIIQHHGKHQSAKGALPFMRDGELVIRDKFSASSFSDRRSLLEACADAKERLATIAYYYRRDWHFRRASRYYQYAQTA